MPDAQPSHPDESRPEPAWRQLQDALSLFAQANRDVSLALRALQQGDTAALVALRHATRQVALLSRHCSTSFDAWHRHRDPSTSPRRSSSPP